MSFVDDLYEHAYSQQRRLQAAGLKVGPNRSEADHQPRAADAKFTIAVGDLASTEKGSAARANGGKPAYDLLPLRMVADAMAVHRPDCIWVNALRHLGNFQDSREVIELQLITYQMGDYWDEAAHVFEYGKGKYAAWNWAKGFQWSVPLACAARHLKHLIDGEELDAESKRHHAGHVMCNVLMLLVFVESFPQGDDLPPKGLLSGT